MNTAKMSLFESLARKVVCPLCGAEIGKTCRTRGLHGIMRQPHEARFALATAPLEPTVDDAAEGPEGDWFDGDHGNALAAVNGF